MIIIGLKQFWSYFSYAELIQKRLGIFNTQASIVLCIL